MYVGSQGNQNKQTNNYSYIDDCLTKSVNFEIFNFGVDSTTTTKISLVGGDEIPPCLMLTEIQDREKLCISAHKAINQTIAYFTVSAGTTVRLGQ